MADVVDVENTLVNLITGVIYPNGTTLPSAAAMGSFKAAQLALPTPTPVMIFRGWPTPQQQDSAKVGNFVNVSVASRNNAERNLSRYPMLPITLSGPVKTLTATVNGNQVIIGGTINVPQNPQNVILLIGPFNQFGYSVQPSDTLTSIAAALAVVVNGTFPGMASATGPVITLNTGRSILARVAGAGQVITVTKQQEKLFQICIWAPPCSFAGFDPDSWRYAVASLIDPLLGQLIRIVLPDQTYGHITYQSSWDIDAAQSEGLYRRDLMYNVEYQTTLTQSAFEIGAMQSQLTGAFTPDGTLATFPTAAPPVGPPTVNAES